MPSMRRLLATALVLAVVAVLTACANTEMVGKRGAAVETQPAPESPPPSGESGPTGAPSSAPAQEPSAEAPSK